MTGNGVETMRNIGPKTAQRLRDVDIVTEARSRALGAVAAYRRVKHYDPTFTTLNCLYALHAAITGEHWAHLSQKEKAILRAEAEC
ncbi:MAG: TfoX/Sxy family DNA transformation protein [Alphaproteobacteria bacterium]|nr:TfoX/Sxy family DNA transformation protein [Alphaproteobacteria bacterium]